MSEKKRDLYLKYGVVIVLVVAAIFAATAGDVIIREGDLIINTSNLVVNSTSGNVGIGTSSPQKLLQLDGTDNLSFSPGNSNVGIDLKNKATVSLPARQVDIGFRGSHTGSEGRYAAITGVVTGSSASGQIGHCFINKSKCRRYKSYRKSKN